MAGELVLLLSSLLIVGVLTQWIAWRVSLPPILLMLAGGLIAGPATGWLDPDVVLGDLLQPLVSLGVAIILFEGGMTLRFRELSGVGSVLVRLVSLGALVTWIVATAAAHLLVGLELPIALLIGAILTVSGPTVVGPLLNTVRPQGPVASLLKWEGIVIDPIGALLAVLVFEAIISGGPEEAALVVVTAVLKTALVGALAGAVAAAILVYSLARYWVPDHLQSAVALALVLAAFVAANAAQDEAGLVAVTVMGLIVANQQRASVRPIVEFKETLRVLIIPSLFILLTARITRADLAMIGVPEVLFLLVLILIARPLAVLVSTPRSSLGLRERLFLAGVMPRGIVAAAISSVLALRLAERGVPGTESLVPLTFFAIIGTVVVYGLGSMPLSHVLGVARQGRGGVLLIGAGRFARGFAHALEQCHAEVYLIDTNQHNITEAKVSELNAKRLDALSEFAHESAAVERVDHVLALTPNSQTNQLCMVRYAEHVGRAEVYRLPMAKDETTTGPRSGRVLFDAEATWRALDARVTAGHYVVRTQLTDKFGYADWVDHHGEDALPLAIVRGQRIEMFATDVRPEPLPGDIIIGLVQPEEPEAA